MIVIPKDPTHSWGVVQKSYSWNQLSGTKSVLIFMIDWDDMDGTRHHYGMDISFIPEGTYYHSGELNLDLDELSVHDVYYVMDELKVPAYHPLRRLAGKILKEIESLGHEYMNLLDNKIEAEKQTHIHSL